MHNSCAIQHYMVKRYREVKDSSTTVVNEGVRLSIGPDKFAYSEEAPGFQRRCE
jgi:hypothetical protein